jgi:tetratricopeptide (TPR) repeat protein
MIVAGCAAGGERGRNDFGDPVLATGTTAESAAASALFQRSYDAEAAGNFEDALAAMGALSEAVRATYTAELRRGWLLHRLGRHAEAVTSYRAASTREPASIESRLGALMPLVDLERWKDVELTAGEVIDRDPENYAAASRLALALARMQRAAEAEVVYRRLLQRYPSDMEVRANLAWTVLAMQRRPEAARLFAEILMIAPHHASALEGWQASSRAYPRWP